MGILTLKKKVQTFWGHTANLENWYASILLTLVDLKKEGHLILFVACEVLKSIIWKLELNQNSMSHF